VLGGAGAGLNGYGTERGGTALGKDDAVDAGPVSNAKQRTQVLRVFYAVEGEQETGAGGAGTGRFEEVFDGKEFLGVHDGDHALVGSGSGELGELLARLLANADSRLAALGDEVLEARSLMCFEALAGQDDVIETAPAGAKSLFHRVDAVENFHKL
jgi:hypothetical protein